MTDSLSAYLPGHFLKTESGPMNKFGSYANTASCECGVKLSWYPREKQHTEHVLSVLQHNAWEQGKEDLAKTFLAPLSETGTRDQPVNPFPVS